MTEVKSMGRDMNNNYEWRKKNIRRYSFTLNVENDKDVYEFFERQSNKRDYLIGLIRKDMNESGRNDQETETN